MLHAVVVHCECLVFKLCGQVSKPNMQMLGCTKSSTCNTWLSFLCATVPQPCKSCELFLSERVGLLGNYVLCLEIRSIVETGLRALKQADQVKPMTFPVCWSGSLRNLIMFRLWAQSLFCVCLPGDFIWHRLCHNTYTIQIQCSWHSCYGDVQWNQWFG